MLTKDEVIYIADMAKLKFEDDQIDPFIEEFTDMVDFVKTIMEVDTDGVEDTLNFNDEGHFKDYDENETLQRHEVLKNTVEEQYGYFKILKVME